MTFDPQTEKRYRLSFILLDTIQFSYIGKIQPFPAMSLPAKSNLKMLKFKKHYLQTMHWLLGEAVT